MAESINATSTHTTSDMILKRRRTIGPAVQLSHIYNHNPAPTYSYLSNFLSITLTDEEGRKYWAATDVKFNKSFYDAVMNSSDRHRSDVMLWVRPKKPETEEERAEARGNVFQPPIADSNLLVTFYHNNVKLVGYIVESGGDAPMSRTSRKTSYVVIRNLHTIDS